jgi:hypothetical protein
MNLYAFTPLIALIINLTLGILIYSGMKHTKSSLSYLAYLGIITCFLFTEFFNLAIQNIETNLIILRYQSVFWIVAATFFLNFVYTLNNHKFLPYIKYLVIAFIPLIYISTQTNAVISGVNTYYWGTDIEAGPLFLPVIGLVFILPMVMSMIYLINTIIKKKSSKVVIRNSVFILIGTMLIGVTISISDILLPHVLHIDNFPRFGPASITIQSLFIFFAIFFYSLLEIKIDRAIGYIFRHSSNSVLIVNPDSSIRYANHAARQLLTVNDEDMFSTNISNILKNDDEYDIKFNFSNKKAWIGTSSNLKTYLISQINVKDWNKDFGKILVIKPTRRESV